MCPCASVRRCVSRTQASSSSFRRASRAAISRCRSGTAPASPAITCSSSSARSAGSRAPLRDVARIPQRGRAFASARRSARAAARRAWLRRTPFPAPLTGSRSTKNWYMSAVCIVLEGTSDRFGVAPTIELEFRLIEVADDPELALGTEAGLFDELVDRGGIEEPEVSSIEQSALTVAELTAQKLEPKGAMSDIGIDRNTCPPGARALTAFASEAAGSRRCSRTSRIERRRTTYPGRRPGNRVSRRPPQRHRRSAAARCSRPAGRSRRPTRDSRARSARRPQFLSRTRHPAPSRQDESEDGQRVRTVEIREVHRGNRIRARRRQ